MKNHWHKSYRKNYEIQYGARIHNPENIDDSHRFDFVYSGDVSIARCERTGTSVLC